VIRFGRGRATVISARGEVSTDRFLFLRISITVVPNTISAMEVLLRSPSDLLRFLQFKQSSVIANCVCYNRS